MYILLQVLHLFMLHLLDLRLCFNVDCCPLVVLFLLTQEFPWQRKSVNGIYELPRRIQDKGLVLDRAVPPVDDPSLSAPLIIE